MRAGGRNEAELVGDGCTGALLTPGEGRRGFPPGEGEAAVGCTGALPPPGEGRRGIPRGEGEAAVGCTGALLAPGEGRRGFPPGEGEAAVGCTGALPTLGEGRRWISRGEAGLTARALALPPCYVNQVNECSGRGPAGRATPERDGQMPRLLRRLNRRESRAAAAKWKVFLFAKKKNVWNREIFTEM